MNAKKLLSGTVSILLLLGITILSWKFYAGFLNQYGVSRLITFCVVDFILDSTQCDIARPFSIHFNL